MAVLMEVISSVRSIRSEMNVPPGRKISLVLSVSDESQKSFFIKYSRYAAHLCKAERMDIGVDFKKPKKSASAVVGRARIFVPLEGVIDFDKEKIRLSKEANALTLDLERLKTRLSNPDFKRNAPPEEVSKAASREKESEEKLARLHEFISSFGS